MFILIILARGRLRQEDCCQFRASLGYILSSRPAWARVRAYSTFKINNADARKGGREEN